MTWWGSRVRAPSRPLDVFTHVIRAAELAASGDLRLACHLADFAGWAAPDDPDIHHMRAEIYETRRKSETSLMSKGIFKGAMRESEKIVKAALGEK